MLTGFCISHTPIAQTPRKTAAAARRHNFKGTVLSLSVKKNWKALSNGVGPNEVGNPVELEEDDLFTPVTKRENLETNVNDPNRNSARGIQGNLVIQDQIVHVLPNQEEGNIPVNEGEDDRASELPEEEEEVDLDGENEELQEGEGEGQIQIQAPVEGHNQQNQSVAGGQIPNQRAGEPQHAEEGGQQQNPSQSVSQPN